MASKKVTGERVLTKQQFMKRVLRKYDEYRGTSAKKDKVTKFWDLVVITTADADQSTVYNRQIASKAEHGELPSDLTFRIYSDPPGVKIGSGGSVLYALKELHDEYGSEMYDWHILLICAGGLSQRLPTASVMGKLFVPLPISNEDARASPYHMLDLKLALYLPFLQRAHHGVFVTCSDDVETYFLPADDCNSVKWDFFGRGFTALGHISSLEIARGHGVYVLDTKPAKDGAQVEMFSCERVLQKPSYEEMKHSNAVLGEGDTVCTDSIYFFDANVCKQFVDIIHEMGSVTCEVDAYGDFLCPLGVKADLTGYIENTRNVVAATSTLSSTRRYLFDRLHPFPLNVVVPKQSQFYHIGLMMEFVENLTDSGESADDTFFEDLNCTNFAFSVIRNSEEAAEGHFQKRFPQVTVMHSVMDSCVQVGARSVVQSCEINGLVTIGHHCIVANCHINNRSSTAMVLPSNSCFHTIAIQIGGNNKFVTIAFSLTDDLKKSSANWTEDLKYMGRSLYDVCILWGVKQENIFDETVSIKSLWTAHLFPIADSMEESFRKTLSQIAEQTKVCDMECDSETKFSMQKTLQYKNVNQMMAFEDHLYKLINHSLNT